MAWTVKIANWREKQHYNNRQPPWIKLHRTLLDKRAWRNLHGSAAKLLVDLWLLAAECSSAGEIDTPLPDIAWRLRVDEAEMYTDLQFLAACRLLEVASGLLQVGPQRRGEERRERETEKTKSNTVADATETGNPESKPYRDAFQRLLPSIRKVLWLPDGIPHFKDLKTGSPWSEGRECTVIRTLMGRGHSVEDLLELIEGLRILRDYNGLYTDPVSWLTPGCQISLRVLFKAQSGAMPVVNLARMAFEKHASRSKRKQSNPEHIGDVMTQLPGAA